ncbi:aspartate dehydrogenase [Aquabacter sp. CN5-332]|uniref:aspartate dehydrogenase n=1 Tax=Aquabacter sp. CN5-332 TaxID=3156608 RepID=UPI0032B407DD
MNTEGSSAEKALRVGIAGLGAIGKAVAERLIQGMPGLRLSAIATRSTAAAEQFLGERRARATLTDLAGLPPLCDVIVEALPASAFDAVAEPALRAGRTLVVISVGALLTRPGLEEVAARHGGRIVVPTGALLGLDAVQAAAQGEIHSVRMVTRKPPRGLAGAPYIVAHKISLDGLGAPLKVFEGTARDAVVGFPANVNVVAALSLAGIGPDRTVIEIWADPALERNHHAISVDSDSASFSMEIANIPSENPKTGRITALSVIAALSKLQAPISVGT